MLLLTKNLAIKGPSKQAAHLIGPFYITCRIATKSYELDLPSSLQVHPVFHIALLKPLPPSLAAQ